MRRKTLIKMMNRGQAGPQLEMGQKMHPHIDHPREELPLGPICADAQSRRQASSTLFTEKMRGRVDGEKYRIHIWQEKRV